MLPPDQPDPPELAALRAEIKKHRSPLYAGLFPLLDAFDRFAVSTVREARVLERRTLDLERAFVAAADRLAHLELAIATQTERIAGVMPAGESIDPDSPLGRQAADELARRDRS